MAPVGGQQHGSVRDMARSYSSPDAFCAGLDFILGPRLEEVSTRTAMLPVLRDEYVYDKKTKRCAR
eukprot:COSAG02_NODE_1248_length_13631_cov_11.854197_9_plen_66_part_00